jgi:peptidoglycan/LPS O-acetylase OafA/YrhL
MAIIKCSECGRAVSDKAAACIGCGAPLAPVATPSAFNLVPKPSITPPLTPGQLRWRLALASLTFVLGVIAADAVSHRPGGGRIASTLAALLVIVGLVWFIVAIVQNVQSRK